MVKEFLILHPHFADGAAQCSAEPEDNNVTYLTKTKTRSFIEAAANE